MKKLIFMLLLSLCFADTITIVADYWFPYNGDPKSKRPGYVVELAKKIFKKHRHKIKYKLLDWEEAIEKTREGQYDAIIGASLEEAPDFIFPKEEIGYSQWTFFVRKGYSWNYNGIKSLKNQRLGIIEGYDNGEELQNYIDSIKNTVFVQTISGNNPLEKNLIKLINNKIDVIIDDKFVALATAKKLGILHKVRIAGNTSPPYKEAADTEDFLYLAFSPNNPKSLEYSKILTEGIQKMRRKRKLKKLLKKYGLVDWK